MDEDTDVSWVLWLVGQDQSSLKWNFQVWVVHRVGSRGFLFSFLFWLCASGVILDLHASGGYYQSQRDIGPNTSKGLCPHPSPSKRRQDLVTHPKSEPLIDREQDFCSRLSTLVWGGAPTELHLLTGDWGGGWWRGGRELLPTLPSNDLTTPKTGDPSLRPEREVLRKDKVCRDTVPCSTPYTCLRPTPDQRWLFLVVVSSLSCRLVTGQGNCTTSFSSSPVSPSVDPNLVERVRRRSIPSSPVVGFRPPSLRHFFHPSTQSRRVRPALGCPRDFWCVRGVHLVENRGRCASSGCSLSPSVTIPWFDPGEWDTSFWPIGVAPKTSLSFLP